MKKLAFVVANVALLAGLSMVKSSFAAPVYVDATTSNTTPLAAIKTTPGEIDDDDLWYERAGRGNSDTILTSQAGPGVVEEDSPMLTTTVTGLAAGTYDVWVNYSANDSWRIAAALSGDSLVEYNANNGISLGVEPNDSAVNRYRAYLGSIVSAGTIAVDIDDIPGDTSGDFRAWYDGVSYELVPEPSAASLIVIGISALGLLRRRRR